MLRCTFSAVAVLNCVCVCVGGGLSSNYTVPAVVSQTMIHQHSFECISLAPPTSSGPMPKHTGPRPSYLFVADIGCRLSYSHTRASHSALVSQKPKALLLHVTLFCESCLLKLLSTTLLTLLLSKPTIWTCLASLPSWPDRDPLFWLHPLVPFVVQLEHSTARLLILLGDATTAAGMNHVGAYGSQAPQQVCHLFRGVLSSTCLILCYLETSTINWPRPEVGFFSTVLHVTPVFQV